MDSDVVEFDRTLPSVDARAEPGSGQLLAEQRFAAGLHAAHLQVGAVREFDDTGSMQIGRIGDRQRLPREQLAARQFDAA